MAEAILSAVRPELVEGLSFFDAARKERCFDKLSTNGF